MKDEGGEAVEAPYPVEDELTEALELGRTEARAIVAGTLGDPMRIPPPVGAGISERENRGEDDDGGE